MQEVRKESDQVAAISKEWPMIRALLSGTTTMREGGKLYLPQWPNEPDESYKSRLAVATLYPAFARTVDVMAAKPFSKPLAYGEDMPTRIREWCDDVDMQGRNLHAFAADTMRDCVSYGLSGVLVDYPNAENIRTQADMQTAGVRPYFARYAPGTILGWKTENRNGADVLIQLRLLETVTEDDGEFGTKQVEQVRVLTPGAWQLWRKVDGKEDWFLYNEGATTLREIPFVFFYGLRKGFGIGLPPLVELAHQNVEYWQSSSDQQTILHVARVPILTVIGANDDSQITVGASTAVNLPVGADMRFVEHSGAAIEAGRVSLSDMEERMRQTGAELLVIKPGHVTATEIHSENEANKCTLQRIAEIFEDALDQCLQYMAEWVGESTGGSVSLFTDFGAASLGEASAELLLKANQSGNLSNETFYQELKRRSIISPELEWADEQERIDGQMSLGMVGDQLLDPVTDPQPAIEPQSTPEPVDMSPVMSALDQLNARIDSLAAQEQAAPDLSPIETRISELSAKVDAIDTKEPDIAGMIAQALQPLMLLLAAQQKPEQKKEESKPKTITIQRDASGQIIGAEVMH